MPLDLQERDNELNQLLIDNSLQGLLIIQDGRIIFVNKAVSEVSGYTAEELQSFSLEDLIAIVHPEDQERAFRGIENLIAGNLTPVRQEFRIIRKDRAIRWIDTLASCIKYQDRPALQLAYLDITDRKMAEEALSESESLLRSFFDSPGVMRGVIEVIADDDVRHIADNEVTAGFLGLTPEAMRNKLGSELSEPREILRTWVSHYKQSQLTGRPVYFEYLDKRKDHEAWLSATVSYLGTPLNGLPRFAYIVSDITERKRMDEELEWLASFPKVNPNPIIEVDLEGCVHFLNPTANKLFPDIKESGCNHPWLTDWEHVKRIFHENKTSTYVRDVFVCESWYQQSIYFVRNSQRIRIYGLDITERKRAEEALKESEEKYRTFVETANEGIWVVDSEARTTYVNRRMAEMLGYSPEEMAGKKSSEFMAEESKASLGLLLERRRQGIHESLEVKFIRKDGSPFWAISSAAPLRDRDGKFVGSLGMLSDITDRKRAEEALRESEQRFVTTLASIGDAVIATDLEGKITFMNAMAEELTGWTFEEASMLPAKAVFKIINDYTRREVDDPITRVLENGAIVGLANNTILIREDGTEIPIDDSGAPIKNLEGDITGVVLVFRDITERRRAENAFREATDYLENLIDYANAPIIVWDSNFRITRFNHAFEKLTGLESNEVLAKPLDILFPENSKEESLAYIRRTLSGEYWEVVEIPIQRTDGSVRTVLWNSANIYNRDGSAVVATIAQGQDITDRKLAEEELRRSRDELELRVQERTAELLKAKEAAEAAVEAKAAFLANMSHELRTPMNAVIGFSSLLLDESLTQEQKEYMEGIRNGGEALLAIINDILEFSRADKKKVELEHQPFSLKHCIDESLDLVAVQADQKGLNLACTIKYGTSDTIIGDHGRLRQILVNLLTNAIKFTDRGDISVSVSSKVIEGNKRQILFEVKDTGIGIPQDKLSEIFRPFTQVERTLSRKRDGVGLGLAITKQLVDLMGGTISAESIPGQGTTFHFSILAEAVPGKRLDYRKLDKARDKVPASISKSRSGQKPLRILVAEDNPSNQKVLVEMLKRLGFRPDAVADGREVIQSLERQDYDLVLMDVKMPEMDGITAAKVIRQLHPVNGPRIIAITAFAMEGDREMCLEAGMDDYISKPVKLDELVELLGKYQNSQGSQ